MKGLIIKDLINLKKNFKIMSGLAILYGLMAVSSGNPSFFTNMFTMVFAILTLSIYSYDDLAKWDGFALTMPVSKDNMVQSRYFMMLLLTLFGSAVSLVFSFIMNGMLKRDSIIEDLQGIGIGATLVILFYSILLPIITKFGVEKARLFILMIFMIPFMIITIVSRSIENGELMVPERLIATGNKLLNNLEFILPLILLIALRISYLISRNIYRRKEF